MVLEIHHITCWELNARSLGMTLKWEP